MGYPRHMRSRNFKVAIRTAGDVSVTSTSFAAVDSALDITLEAQIGDVIELGINANWDNGAVNSEMDVAVMNGATLIRYISGTTRGIPAWGAVASVTNYVAGSYFTTLVTGDVLNGLVTVRLSARVFSTGTRVLYASTNPWPLQFIAKNLGPPDPH